MELQQISPSLTIGVVVCYFLFLLGISYWTSRSSDEATFFTGNRKSPWYLVAFGMIGASLSGVTFISVPGEVGNSSWHYLQFVMGNVVGYWLIALVLIPIFYRLELVSIYEFLKERFGVSSYKTGSFYFLLSQTIGASFRLFLAASVLQIAISDHFGIPFWMTVLMTLLLIWLYTYKSGIKTIVWTDTLQTFFLLSAVVLTIVFLASKLELSDHLWQSISSREESTIFNWDWRSKNFFWKKFIAGVFIAIAMNGLDQNVMQKNLTCRSMKDAQRNIIWFSLAFFVATILFLSLGVLLYQYGDAFQIQLPTKTDEIYPFLAMNYFGESIAILFLLGITAAAFSSADSALTALTTSFCVDFLNHSYKPSKHEVQVRRMVHVGFSALVFAVIVIFRILQDDSVVTTVFKVAGYTYGPLLGLFAFGLSNKRVIKDKWVPLICILSPLLSWVLNTYSQELFWGYQFGFEILLVNAVFTMIGLWIVSSRKELRS
ncbi:sodium:solute symporter [Sediminitomix flava]|uniref:SSS family transporter n=1 Tax=Sediminitomix flava TaxID=379075 RepID=A0A315ZG07_SEDFL|nr:sodium:solute symporter [Sediminitomix flava]PWJ44451.1 SSS family transporter [Sediminitomix flava]